MLSKTKFQDNLDTEKTPFDMRGRGVYIHHREFYTVS